MAGTHLLGHNVAGRMQSDVLGCTKCLAFESLLILDAVVAFIRTLPPQKNKVEPNPSLQTYLQ